jgi:hypothetical protein
MSGPRIVATAAFLLLLPQFNNADAAGPYDGEWTGTVDEHGAVGATIGFQPLRGQFRGVEFEGTFQELRLRMEGSSQAHEVTLCAQLRERKAALPTVAQNQGRHPSQRTRRRRRAYVFAHACQLGAVGIVSKKVDGAYQSGPCPIWIEVRNPASIAVQRERSEIWNRRASVSARRR